MATLVYTTDAKPGGLCIGCTFLVHISQELARKRHFKISDALNYWCESLGGDQKWMVDVCKIAFSGFAEKIQIDFNTGRSPDFTCVNSLEFCDKDSKCSLFPQTTEDLIDLKEHTNTLTTSEQVVDDESKPRSSTDELFISQFSSTEEANSILDFIVSALTGWSKVGGIKRFEDYSPLLKHKPSSSTFPHPTFGGHGQVGPLSGDDDGDGSSTFQQLRGFDWRGKDCDDTDNTIYPSRKDSSGKSHQIDHDCNGIFGTDEKTGKSFEELFCADTKRFEFVQIGDSASAGFTIPPCWLSADCIAPGVYKELLPILMNEADFPACAAVTGFNPQSCPSLYTSITPFTSVYSFARDNNPCIHRSYHNIGINGADSVSMGGSGDFNQILSFKRDQKKDYPVALFFALIGNDVCSTQFDEASMTDPDVFEQSWLNSLDYLDTQMPPGSWAFLGGLVDGSLLFDIMHDEIHPIGKIKYSNLYDFLNCYETSPCSGWLNKDPNVRKRTTEHAHKLNDRLKNIVKTKKYKNFQLQYNDYEQQVQQIITWATQKGFKLKNFIADVDSFHPSSTLYSKLAQSFINRISLSDAAEIFSLNPKKDQIFAQFGPDLNGY